MSDRALARAAGDIPGLKAVLLTAMPECLLDDSWHEAQAEWAADNVASYLGDPIHAIREALKALQLDRITVQLPSYKTEETPRGVRIVGLLQRCAPDPDAVLLRVAPWTGAPAEGLEQPEALDDERIVQIEDASRQILGLAELSTQARHSKEDELWS